MSEQVETQDNATEEAVDFNKWVRLLKVKDEGGGAYWLSVFGAPDQDIPKQTHLVWFPNDTP
jgi:hypothetical protein